MRTTWRKMAVFLLLVLAAWEAKLLGAVPAGEKAVARAKTRIDAPALEPPIFVAGLLSAPPRLDGRIEQDEWSGAATLAGFIDRSDRQYSRRQGRVWVGYDRSNLYLAYRSQFPPGRLEGDWDEQALRAFVHQRNGQISSDDSIEVYLAPETPEKIIQFVGNSRGAIGEVRYGYGQRQSDWRFENHVDNAAGVWELELAVSFASLGVKPPRPGDTWGFNFARNWRGLGNALTSLTGDYRVLLGRLRFAASSPVVREESWGMPLAGRVDAAWAVMIPGGAARRLVCRFSVEDDKGTPVASAAREETLEVAPERPGRFSVECRLAEKGAYTVGMTVLEPGKESAVYRRCLPLRVYDPVQLSPFYVLSTQKLGVLIDLTKMPAASPGKTLRAEVVLSTRKGELARRELELSPESQSTVYFPLSQVPGDRELSVSCRVDAERGEAFQASAEYQVPLPPPWLGQYVVPDDFVPEPWPVLQVTDGREIRCWNRVYVFGASPLPEKILVDGQDLLRAPVRLHIDSASGPLVWDDGPARVEHQCGAKVILSKSGRARDLTVTVRTTVEFDGFCAFDTTITPRKPTAIAHVGVDVPIRPEVARFFHVDGNWGEKLFGPVARRADYPALATERHYYWLGNDDVGLCWLTDLPSPAAGEKSRPRIGFRESAQGFSGFFEPLSGSRIVRGPLNYFFAIQATPTRPPRHRPIRAFFCYNTPPDKFHSPLAKNADNVLEMSLAGAMNYPPPDRDLETIRDWIAGYKRKGLKFCIYQFIDPGTETDDYRDYWGDWVTQVPPETHQWRTMTARCCLNSSWSDCYAAALDRMMREFGVDGIYMDGVGVRDCLRGDAHGGACAEGRWPILAAREHFKKVLYVARRNKGRESVLFGHVSVSTIAPLAGLMDALLKGENYGRPLTYDDLTEDVLRSEFGRQWGPQAVFLPQLTKKQIIPTGKLLGHLALHGVECAPSFLPTADRQRLLLPMWQALDRFPVSEARFLPYFAQRLFTEDSGRPVSVYASREGGRFLVIVANQTDRPTAYSISYHPQASDRPGSIVAAVDRISGKPVPQGDGHCRVEVEPWGFAMVEVRVE